MEVTDSRLEALKTLQREAIWDVFGDHKANYVLGLLDDGGHSFRRAYGFEFKRRTKTL